MITFVAQLVFMLSLGAIIYIVARALPRIDDRAGAAPEVESRWFTDRLDALDVKARAVAEKSLRRSEVILLKLENIVRSKLQKIKKESSSGSISGINGIDKTGNGNKGIVNR